MDWVKLHTRFYVDPKVASLPDADTEMMFVRSLAYAGDQETSGFIPESIVPLLTRKRRHAGCVKALVESGLWTKVTGGYRIGAWSDWQDQLDVLANRRAADRERKRKSRARQRQELAEKSGDQCRRCGTRDDLVVDHIIPKSRGGTDAVDNLQILCWSCNAQKRNLTEKEYDAWLAETNYPLPPGRMKSVRGLSADVTVLEGEEETELRKGGMSTHDPPANSVPPPRRCPIHISWTGPVPPCGACADARHTHDTWQPASTNGTGPARLRVVCDTGCANGWHVNDDGPVTRCHTCNPDPLEAIP